MTDDRDKPVETAEQAKLAAVYSQDGDSWRYQDQLRWSRFQVALTIQGGALYGLYETSKLSDLERFGLEVIAFALILVLFWTAILDAADARAHINRMFFFEDPISPYRPSGWRPGSGAAAMYSAMATVCVMNVYLLVKFGLPLINTCH